MYPRAPDVVFSVPAGAHPRVYRKGPHVRGPCGVQSAYVIIHNIARIPNEGTAIGQRTAYHVPGRTVGQMRKGVQGHAPDHEPRPRIPATPRNRGAHRVRVRQESGIPHPGRTDRNLIRLYQLLDIPQCVELFRKQEPNLNRKTALSLLSLIGAKALYGKDYGPYKGRFPEA